VEAKPRKIEIYLTASSSAPYLDWLGDYKGQKIHGVILNRIDRVKNGNLGDSRSVGDGVFELRIDVGPGYRIYFGQDGDSVVLLHGGTKKTQDKDIKIAKEYWEDYRA
jgi:putative addiction module killer protein